MLGKKTLKMRSFNSVASGETATLSLPIGHTYHDLILILGGDLTVALTGRVNIVSNGDIIDSWKTGTQITEFNDHKDLVNSSGILHIPFERLNLLNREHRERTAIGTGMKDDPDYISSLVLEVEILAGSTSPALTCYAVVSKASYAGIIRQTRHFTFNALSDGEYEIADLPRGLVIDKVFFRCFDPSDDSVVVPNEVSLKLANEIVFQRTNALNEHIQLNGVRDPQGEYFVFDPSEEGYGSEGLRTDQLQEMVFTLDLPEDATIACSVEYLGGLPRKAA